MTGIYEYVNFDLFVPASVHRLNETLVATSGGGADSAFEKQIDMWWTGLILGVREGRRTAGGDVGDLVKFNTASILASDPWRLPILELVAIAESGPSVLTRPREVITIGSEYAYTGLLFIADRLRANPDPLLALVNILKEISSSEDMRSVD